MQQTSVWVLVGMYVYVREIEISKSIMNSYTYIHL